jgi:6-phosphofructokinase 1
MTSRRNQVDPDGDLWMSVLETTCQPAEFGPAPDRRRVRTGFC